MRRALILAALLAAAPALAQEIPTMSLEPGDAVVVRFDDGGRVGEPERRRAEWTPFDLYAARHLSGQTPPEAPVPVGEPFTAPEDIRREQIPAGEVRIRFFTIAGQHALLVVENGQGMALRYRARMTVRGAARHTDVCVVLAHLPSYEHWPHTIERIELSDFRFISWLPGRAPTCE